MSDKKPVICANEEDEEQFCENCEELIASGDDWMTEDDVLLCGECYRACLKNSKEQTGGD